MASLYKKPIIMHDPETGERIKTKSRKWWGRYRDNDGRERRVPLAGDKTAAQTMLNEIVKKVERQVAGLEDPFEKHLARPLARHVKDFVNYLRNKGNTECYARHTAQRLSSAIGACRFGKISDISASRFQAFLGDLRRQGFGITSCNHYLRAFKMFNRWLVRDRRTREDVVAHLSVMNSETDRRRMRRPLSPEEFERLLETTHDAPPIQHITGPDRVVLYILACYTGLRRNEIHSLTRQSFDLGCDPPTVTVEAAYSKRRRRDVLPMRRDLAEYIARWMQSRRDLGSDERLLRISGKRTAEMLRTDLEGARAAWLDDAKTAAEKARRAKSSFLQYRDEAGRVADFHALRKTFITNLCRAGVSPKAAQSLARHSDINLTMNVYTMLSVHDHASAVEALPAIPQPKQSSGNAAAKAAVCGPAKRRGRTGSATARG